MSELREYITAAVAKGSDGLADLELLREAIGAAVQVISIRESAESGFSLGIRLLPMRERLLEVRLDMVEGKVSKESDDGDS